MNKVQVIPRRILVVCSGNTCRSPMAEALLRRLIGGAAEVQSAGMDAADGLPPTNHAVSVMKELGLDIGAHRSQDINRLDVAAFPLIVAMDSSITEKLQKIGVDPLRIAQLEVEDPYHKGPDVYRSTAEDIDRQLRFLFGVRDGSSIKK